VAERVGEGDEVVFLIGVETAPLAMLEPREMAAASEALLDVLAASGWAQDAVTAFRESDRVLGARFFIEAEDLSAVDLPGLVFDFLQCVVLAVGEVVPGERLPAGTVFQSGEEIQVQPETVLAKVQIEQAPAA
jgi:hypothetical protein